MNETEMTTSLSNLFSFEEPELVRAVAAIEESNNHAKWMHERVVRLIKDFEEKLDNDHEIGARLVTFGTDTTIHIQDVGYWGPDLITFQGLDANNNSVQLVQHISQLSVLLVAVKRTGTEPRRIGFKLEEKLERKRP